MAAFQPSGILTRGSGPMCPGVLTLWPKAAGVEGIHRESDVCCFIITGVGCTEKMYICIDINNTSCPIHFLLGTHSI